MWQMTEVSFCRSVASLPPAARDGKPSQVQCRTHPQTAREQLSPGRFPSRALPPGNSHSRVPWPLLAIPDAPPACFRHWRRQAPIPQGAHGENLAKYNVALTRRRPGSSSLPGVFPHAVSTRGTRIVAPPGRSLRFPTLRLPVSATGGGRLRSHRARMGKT